MRQVNIYKHICTLFHLRHARTHLPYVIHGFLAQMLKSITSNPATLFPTHFGGNKNATLLGSQWHPAPHNYSVGMLMHIPHPAHHCLPQELNGFREIRYHAVARIAVTENKTQFHVQGEAASMFPPFHRLVVTAGSLLSSMLGAGPLRDLK